MVTSGGISTDPDVILLSNVSLSMFIGISPKTNGDVVGVYFNSIYELGCSVEETPSATVF